MAHTVTAQHNITTRYSLTFTVKNNIFVCETRSVKETAEKR